MKASIPAYHISPLGDSALLVDFGNRIDEDLNKMVLAKARQLTKSLPGILEAVPAYSSISVYFDMIKWRKRTPQDKLVFDHLKEITEQVLLQQAEEDERKERIIKIPVCYSPEMGSDMEAVAQHNNISTEEVMTLHLSKSYRVYMLGFLPGFCYLGETDPRITMPRKMSPVPVAPGSVGIAGKQTGIYPLASPGGWQIIGRTPSKLFDPAADEPTLLRAGDSVQLYAISTNDFFEIQNSDATIRMTE